MVLAGGETDSYRDSGLAAPREGERARMRDGGKEEVDGGVVKLTVPPFNQVLGEHQKQKRTSEATLSAGGLLQTPTAKHQDNTSLCLQPLIC